jgi:hypothetical protein
MSPNVVHVVPGDYHVMHPTAVGVEAMLPEIPDFEALHPDVAYVRPEVPGLQTLPVTAV